jgi:hypothetical protein
MHLGDGGGQETTKGTSKRRSGEKESSTESEFLALVPATAPAVSFASTSRRKTYER